MAPPIYSLKHECFKILSNKYKNYVHIYISYSTNYGYSHNVINLYIYPVDKYTFNIHEYEYREYFNSAYISQKVEIGNNNYTENNIVTIIDYVLVHIPHPDQSENLMIDSNRVSYDDCNNETIEDVFEYNGEKHEEIKKNISWNIVQLASRHKSYFSDLMRMLDMEG